MKVLLIGMLVFGSVSAFAGFTCVEEFGDKYLITSGSNPVAVKDLKKCQSAVDKSKNGFVCIETLRSGNFLVPSDSKPVEVPDLKTCQNSIEKSKNGFVCVEEAHGGNTLVTSGSEVIRFSTLAKCQNVIDKSK